MKSEEVVHLVFSFMGGGFIAGLMNWMHSTSAARATRATDYLTQQIKDLYGPLYFVSSENESIFHHTNVINDAYKTEYIDIQYAESARESIREETTRTIDLNNRYVQVMTDNNNKMVDILNQHYGLIDTDDMQAFQTFREHVMRYKIEQEIKPTWRVLDHLKEIRFYESDFAALLKTRFIEKSNQLKQLRKHKSCWAYIQHSWQGEKKRVEVVEKNN